MCIPLPTELINFSEMYSPCYLLNGKIAPRSIVQ
jgi:hypothetical protein